MTSNTPADLGLVYQQHAPDEPAPDDGFPTVIALHGRGSYAGDLLGLAPFFGHNWLTIAPQAPLERALGAQVGYHWYDVLEVGEPEPQGFNHSLDLLRQFVARLPQLHPVDPQRLFLLGFSQGAVMAYALGLTDPDRFAGIAALSGYIAPQTQHDAAKDRLAGQPVFVAHGTYDNIITLDFGHAARDWLHGVAADVEYHEYQMGHQIDHHVLNDLVRWLHRHGQPTPKQAPV